MNMFEGELFSTSDIEKFYIYLEEDLSSDLSLLGYDIVDSRESADLIYRNDKFYSQETEFSLEDLIESRSRLVDFFKMRRVDIRYRRFLELKQNLYFSFKEGGLSLVSYWKFLKLCYETSLEYSGIEEIIYRVSRNAELKKLVDLDIYSSQELGEKQLGEDICLELDLGKYIVGDYVDIFQNAEAFGALFAILNFIDNFKSELQIEKALGEDISLKEIFSLINYPMVVLDQDGIVSLLNDKFSSLSILPSTLVEHREIGWLEYQNERYKILHENINQRFCLYTLVKQESDSKPSLEGQSELGIISGSIAHELNNPVAGILAAITLLELEEWDEENLTALKEMKESGMRCKGLIDTFLGFSRYRGIGPVVKPLGLVLEQSTSLLRYRIVESGLTINVSTEDQLECRRIKASVMPMVFYLLFNEILTILSHKLLIDPSLGRTINLSFSVSAQELWIVNESFSYDIEDEKKFDIKLIDHLMEMEKMEMSIEDGVIKLIGIFDEPIS